MAAAIAKNQSTGVRPSISSPTTFANPVMWIATASPS
jgi:hypothetical protein